MITPLERTKESYKAAQKESGIAIGDSVIVMRRAKSRENGWNADWVTGMNEFVGKTCEVIKQSSHSGFLLESLSSYTHWWFPYFVLQPEHTKKSFLDL